MKKRDVVGRRIVDVRQDRVWNNHLQRSVTALLAVYLDNGTCISLSAVEMEDQPMVEGTLVRLK